MRNNWLSKAVTSVGATFSFFYLYTAGFGIFSSESNRGMYLLFTMVLCFLIYPFSKKRRCLRVAVDLVAISLAIIGVAYWMMEFPRLVKHIGLPPRGLDLLFGALLMILVIEVARRVHGFVIPILTLFFIAYSYFGPYFPGGLRHAGVSAERIVEYCFITMDGIFGLITMVFATYVMIFIIFGSFLEKSGVGRLFIDLAFSTTGHKRGGPALSAIVASGVMGMISGSPVANVAATGTFTIPLMKKSGYPPYFAAAVEASASTGGQIMPPVMGAAAFLLATFVGIPYIDVVKISVIPAIFYFFSIGFMTYLEACKRGLKPIEKVPSIKMILNNSYMFSPIILLIILLVYRYSPFYAAFWATILTIILGMTRKESRMGIRQIIEALTEASKKSLTIGSLAGVLGILYANIILSGLTIKFPLAVLELSKGMLLPTLLILLLTAIMVGMAMPTTATYVITSILAVPALLRLGIDPLVAHMFAFWASLFSNVTPPVCVAVFTACAIAQSEIWKTAFTALKLASWLFIIPFLFIYTPLLTGSPYDVFLISLKTFIGIVTFCGAVQGFLLGSITVTERSLLFLATVTLIHPSPITDIIGLILLLAVIIKRKVL